MNELGSLIVTILLDETLDLLLLLLLLGPDDSIFIDDYT